MLHDPLADALSAVKNAERAGKREVVVRHATRLLKEVLKLMQAHGYVGNFELIEDGRGGQVRIELRGRINDCGAIKPRFPVRADGYEVWEKRYLPAAGVGMLIVATPAGLKSHREVKGKLGGALIAYVY